VHAWAPEVFFSMGWPAVDFSGVAKKNVPRGAKSGEISSYPLETKKQPFSLKI